MPEKYTRIGTLGENLYTENTPLILEKTALTVNNENGAVFAQVKMKNIGDNVIKAVKVVVSSKDDFGKVLPDTEFTYLDLNLVREATAGEKMPIFLADNSARSASVRLDTVAFADGSILSVPKDAPICVIPEQETVAQHFSDDSLWKQYGIKYGIDAANAGFPMHFHDLWFCSCGTCNRSVEETCYRCGKKIADFDSLNEEELKRERDARLVEEQRIADEKRKKEEERRIAAEAAAEAATKKLKKAVAIGTPIVAAYIAFVIVLTTVIIPNSKYNAAVKLMDDGKYEEAISAFEAMEGYKDSDEQIEACQTAIKDIAYDSAVSLMKDENYEEAITAFEALNGYKDSENQIESCYIGKYGEEKWNKIKNIKIGDTYTFGAYEQDNNTSNVKEAIEWTVLDKDGMSLLLVSKQALDCQQYKTSYTNVTWESCSLRKWMNGTFLNNAFSAEEQSQIQNTNVSADENPKYSTNPGNATTDKVFLLSITEAKKYFTTDESRKCALTAYVKAQGAYTRDSYKTASGKATCWWWLRSPGNNQRHAATVDIDGSFDYYGHTVDHDCGCVRPALWINLE